MCVLWIGVFVSLRIMIANSFDVKSRSIVDQIEGYAAMTRIELTQLLIVDITGTLSNHSFNTKASLLSEANELNKRPMSKGKPRVMLIIRTVGPWFLNALAAPPLAALLAA